MSNPFDLKKFTLLANKYRIYAPDTIGHPGKSSENRLSPKDNSYGEWAIDSDNLIYEATLVKALAKTAEDKKHSTSIDATNDEKKMNARQLILTHISSRYQEDAVKLLEESKEIFPNTILAEDLLRIELK